jgi:hypothetical protein
VEFSGGLLTARHKSCSTSAGCFPWGRPTTSLEAGIVAAYRDFLQRLSVTA